MAFVADASVTIAWVVVSQASPETNRLLDEISTGTVVHVPGLWPYETTNVLLTLERRGKISSREAHDTHGFYRRMKLIVDPVDRTHVEAARVLAVQHQLTLYDATYLELAIRLGLPLATKDSALLRAAVAVGVPLA